MTLELKIEIVDTTVTKQSPSPSHLNVVGIVRIYLETEMGVNFTLHEGELIKFGINRSYYINGLPWVQSDKTLEGLLSNIRDRFLVVGNENKLYVPKRGSRQVIKTLTEMCDFDVTHLADIVMIKML